uniref:Large ribosomal subunit protein uL18c n=1 Tax=Nitzschia alba TaxID=2858 RepID=A0A5C0F4X3_NITAL|nr:50S ribosomal protein L18 [Nitzschia alba]QEI59600.1 50S ribosomal protein L18 [Nitzschia alba]
MKKINKQLLHLTKKGTWNRPRLSIYRSNRHLYAQIINDIISKTIISYSTLKQSLKFKKYNTITCNNSYLMGKTLARLCLKKGILKIIFDRNSYLYHGHVKAVADGARLGGLKF